MEKIEPRGIIPSPRSMHSETVDRKIYIFGGGNSAGSSNDTSAKLGSYLDLKTNMLLLRLKIPSIILFLLQHSNLK